MKSLPPSLNAPEPLPPARRRGSFKPVLITVGVAFLLLAGSVCGAFATCGSMNSPPAPSFKFFTFCVFLSLGFFALSIAWLLLSLLIWLIQKLS